MGVFAYGLSLGLLAWWAAGAWLGEKTWGLRPWRRSAPASELEAWLQDWQLGFQQGRPLRALGQVPSYKFFGRLAETGLTHARTYGSFPREVLWEWREGVAKEKEFERRWREVRDAGWAQFALFAAVTWLFVLTAGNVLGDAFPMGTLLAVGAAQGMGAGLFWPCLQALARHRLEGFGPVLESLYALRTLSTAGLPGQTVLQEARLGKLKGRPLRRLGPLLGRLEEIVGAYQRQGVPLAQETQLLIQEAWFLRQEELTRMVKLAEGVKLGVLLVFFGGAYGLALAGLMGRLVGG